MFTKKYTARSLLGTLLVLLLLSGCSAKAPVYAPDDATRQTWLASRGWQISPTPVESLRLQLPSPLDEAWMAYADAQAAQGLPLSNFAGRMVERITYRVEAPPQGWANAQVNLFLCGDQIIGGDVYVPGPDGFQTALTCPKP